MEAKTHTVNIYIGTDAIDEAYSICQQYCDEIGLCVSIFPCEYIYTGGRSSGMCIRLINYPRFPSLPRKIDAKAMELAKRLGEACSLRSLSIESPIKTKFLSFKEPVMAKAKPGSTSTRKVTRGPNKGDTVKFVANKAGTQHPGKQVPRRVVKDVGPKNTAASLPKGKKK